MTRAHRRTNRGGIPSLSQLLLAAMLCLLAELVQNVAVILRMKPSRLSGECHTDVTPPPLPEDRGDQQETNPAAATSQTTTEALMVSSAASAARPSNHEGVLTGASFKLVQHRGLSSRKREALSGTHSSASGLADPWLPALRGVAAPAGMTVVTAARFRVLTAP
jgi:hypothetical protein